MGTTIKAFGLDRNADAADRGLERGVGRLKKKEGGRGLEGKGKKQALSAERPVQPMPCTEAQNYLRFNDPIHSLEPPPTPTDKQHKNPG